MSILLRNRITGITTSTDLFGEDLALFLREYPDLVKVGIGTTANQPYYILLNETIEEFRSPYANNGLSYNPSTGTLSAGVFSGNGSGLSNVTATGSGIEIKDDNVPVGTARTVNFANNLSVTFASGIATVSGASSVSFATSSGIATSVIGGIGSITQLQVTGGAYISGNLGIGTTNPSTALSVAGTITELYAGQYWNLVSQADVGIGASQVPLNQYLGQLAFVDDFSPNGLRRDGGGEDDVTVNSSGFVGIGTPNPTSKLHVVGDVMVTGTVTATTFVGALTGTASNVTTNANLTGHVTSVGNAAVLGSFTSLQLLTALTDETGSGSAVFATSPTLVTPALGTPASGNLTNCTALNASQLSTGTVPTARLASGTANSSTYLRGDQTWQSISAPSAEFASGTTIVFYQASAPTGWTKSTSHDNKALRVVSGTGGGSGGSSSFTSVFASRGVPLLEHNHSASSGNHDGHQHSGPTNSQSIDHNHSFTTGNQSANHTHTFTTNGVGDHNHLINGYITANEAGGYGLTLSGGFENRVLVTASNGQGTTYAGGHDHGGTTAGMSVDHNHSGTTSGGGGSHSHDFTTQSGGSHNHSISVSNNGTASASMDFAVQYIDVIICSKN